MMMMRCCAYDIAFFSLSSPRIIGFLFYYDRYEFGAIPHTKSLDIWAFLGGQTRDYQVENMCCGMGWLAGRLIRLSNSIPGRLLGCEKHCLSLVIRDTTG